MKKKLIAGVLVASMGIMSFTTMAKTVTEEVNVSYNDMKVYIKDVQIKGSTEPFMMDGQIYIGIEDLANHLNYEVQKDDTGQIIKLVEKMPISQGMTKEKENNDTYTQANPINLNGSVTGVVGEERSKGNKDAKDHFELVVPQDGELNLTLVGDPGLGAYLYLLREDGSSSIDWVSGSNKQLSITKPVQKGVYYVLVKQSSKVGGYTLTNTFTPQTVQNDIEVNDSFQVALPYQFGTTVTGHIGYINTKGVVDKQDWYKLSLNESRQVEFLLEATKDAGVYLEVFKENASTSVDWVSGTNKQLSVSKRLEAGTYYIRVKQSSGAGGYTLKTK